MIDLLTASNVTFILGVLGVIFGVYHYFKNPQIDLDKRQAVSEKETDGRAHLLAEQFKWERDLNDKRFAEMQTNIKEATQMAANHIHSIDVRVEALATSVNEMNLHLTSKIVELSTKLDQQDEKVG